MTHRNKQWSMPETIWYQTQPGRDYSTVKQDSPVVTLSSSEHRMAGTSTSTSSLAPFSIFPSFHVFFLVLAQLLRAANSSDLCPSSGIWQEIPNSFKGAYGTWVPQVLQSCQPQRCDSRKIVQKDYSVIALQSLRASVPGFSKKIPKPWLLYLIKKWGKYWQSLFSCCLSYMKALVYLQ